MRSIVRVLFLSIVAFLFVIALGGCGGSNEESMAGTKGAASDNAPKTQAEFFEQQQLLNKVAKTKVTSLREK